MLTAAQRSTGVEPLVSPSRRDSESVLFPHYINRDLSLLEFFRRVLEEGLDEDAPLLDRLKFLTILASNLDEFFMIRVSALKEKLDSDVSVSQDGYSLPELADEIRRIVLDLTDQQMTCLRDEIMPELVRKGITIEQYEKLTADERRILDRRFEENIYPLLTPQAVDPTHPFPYISGGSLNLGLKVKPILNRRVARALIKVGSEFFVRVKIPLSVPRLMRLHPNAERFVPVEEVIRGNIRRLIPEASPSDCHLFRLTRDADVSIREDESEDLLQTMEDTLKLRRFGDVVRLETSALMPREMVDYLADSLNIGVNDIYSIDGPLDLVGFSEICGLNHPELKAACVRSRPPAIFDSNRSTFDIIRDQDVLLHHPYMPYSIVTDLIKEAVHDPQVLAIKMCLYRIGAESPIAPLLMEASQCGKQVTVLIEIKARFDEANNIEWARKLEEAGVHVVYGMLGLKTHCKTTLIVRQEDEKLVRYVHVATGNYNPETSAFYTDLGLLTANPEIGEDATELFNYLTVYSARDEFKQLVVAPINLRERMIELIEGEAEHARQGRPARIIAKMNRLADTQVVDALYAASQAGVEIDLIVRGICTLRPNVPGLSENIRVRSVVGSLLEHSRVYYFANGGDEKLFMGSSDWMPRNLDRRIEVLAPIDDPSIRNYLKYEFLDTYLKDNLKARQLQPDGSYSSVERVPGDVDIDSQLSFQSASQVMPFKSRG